MFTQDRPVGWVDGPRPIRPTHNATHGSDAIRKYSDFMLHRRYGVKYFLQEGLKATRVIWKVWSPGPADASDHMGGKSPCSVSQTFFKCESQCLWYKTYRSGKGTREPSEPSLPSFDKGMGQIPMLYLQEEQDYMFTAAQLCTPRFLNVLSYRLEKESREPQIVESNYRAMWQHFEK